MASDTLQGAFAAIEQDLRASLETLRGEAATADRTERAERKRALAALGSDEIAKLTRDDKELASDVEAAREALEAQTADAKARAKALEETIAEWTAELDAIGGPKK